MVGVRIAPDGYDIVVWRLDESNAPFVNSSTSPNSPGSSANLTNINNLNNGTYVQQPSPFAATGTNSAVTFSGNQSGSRNSIYGAITFNPQPPITVSGWYFNRAYNNGLTTHGISKQTQNNTWSGTLFSCITLAQNEGYASKPTWYDFSITYNSGGSGVNANVSTDINIPLGQWSHIGLTYDGTNVDGYINGNWVSSATGPGFNSIFYAGSPGPWFVGAIPGGSGSPEESNASFCDIRIANVIRPLSYFQNIYQLGTQNTNSTVSLVTNYYKMRAYDLGCSRAFPVYWIDSAINYNNAPTPPCGGPLGPIEIMEIYPVLNG